MTIALARARRTPDQIALSARSLHTTKVRDNGFCERTSYRTSLLVSLTICTPFFSFRFHHQMTFTANWICLEVVDVESINPAPATGAPDPSKIILLSVGGLKLGRLRILKNSVRNCTLKVSEILLIGLFLNNDMSKVARPGPIRVFRPELTRRLGGFGKAK